MQKGIIVPPCKVIPEIEVYTHDDVTLILRHRYPGKYPPTEIKNTHIAKEVCYKWRECFTANDIETRDTVLQVWQEEKKKADEARLREENVK